MGGAGGWGVVMPVGALGAGVGSAIATGIRAGRGAALGRAWEVAVVPVAGGDLGRGGRRDEFAEQFTLARSPISAALRTRPDCRAQMPARAAPPRSRRSRQLRLTPPGAKQSG